MLKINSNPWPLFTNNIDFACSWTKLNIDKYGLKSNLGHRALSLGMSTLILNYLKKDSTIDESVERGLRFRIARRLQEKNPHKHLYHKRWHDIIDNEMTNSIKNGFLKVSLNGGLGDHLEAFSLLIPYAVRHNLMLNIDISEKYKKIFNTILLNNKYVKISDEDGLNYTAVRYWLNNNENDLQFKPWIKLESNNQTRNKYLFCWKAAIGTDKFSCHIRSIPFQYVLRLYKELVKNNNATILDISKWNAAEEKSLKKIGIKLYNPEKGSLNDLIKLISGSEIATIDTALAHLCASLGKKAFVLLPYLPDERWLELCKEGNTYIDNLTFIQQDRFFSWEKPMNKLSKLID